MNARLIALNILMQVLKNHRSLTKAIPAVMLEQCSHAITSDGLTNRAFIQELCYGVCRWYFQLDFLLNQLLEKPLKKNHLDIYILLLIGIYQLLYTQKPSYAIVNETVKTLSTLKKTWGAGLVNATLRNFIRQKEVLLQAVDQNDVAKTAHPEWLLDLLKRDWAAYWQSIVASNNQYPVMSLRINTRQVSREDYLKKLLAASIKAIGDDDCDTCVILEKPVDVHALPEFETGHVFVQDCSAQYVAKLLDLKPHQRVLDACAAPGGKTTHILTLEPNLETLVAIDKDEVRLRKVEENLHRMHLKAQLIHADVSDTASWWDHQLFDRILLDAPCSGTGVIQRHSDIKILKQEADIAGLQQAQLKLLRALWPLLKPEGQLLYVTCSVLANENEQVIEAFLRSHQAADEIKLHIKEAITRPHGIQILPSSYRNGFYYACLRKACF